MGRRRGSGWMPRSRKVVNTTSRDRALINRGWQIGMLCAGAVLHDDPELDLSNERIHQIIMDCDTLMYSMAKDTDDWRKVQRNLEDEVGIRLTLKDGETPPDGRFAIVDEWEGEDDEA